ncbi:MAG: hypothetical protein ATN33_01165 [Epulopiscium sp. Nele67-Bin001]|nr:MAG: hypothetical protein BEN18_05360 [Epulopiscium sp. Nuni2H_MBin001]OON91446.1 MAG: hypothetical protein ATN33_01165 [Epulopiscium sp. Nele67-Bin001]
MKELLTDFITSEPTYKEVDDDHTVNVLSVDENIKAMLKYLIFHKKETLKITKAITQEQLDNCEPIVHRFGLIEFNEEGQKPVILITDSSGTNAFEPLRNKKTHENNLSMFMNGNSLSNITNITYKRHKPEIATLGRKKRKELLNSLRADANFTTTELDSSTVIDRLHNMVDISVIPVIRRAVVENITTHRLVTLLATSVPSPLIDKILQQDDLADDFYTMNEIKIYPNNVLEVVDTENRIAYLLLNVPDAWYSNPKIATGPGVMKESSYIETVSKYYTSKSVDSALREHTIKTILISRME